MHRDYAECLTNAVNFSCCLNTYNDILCVFSYVCSLTQT